MAFIQAPITLALLMMFLLPLTVPYVASAPLPLTYSSSPGRSQSPMFVASPMVFTKHHLILLAKGRLQIMPCRVPQVRISTTRSSFLSSCRCAHTSRKTSATNFQSFADTGAHKSAITERKTLTVATVRRRQRFHLFRMSIKRLPKNHSACFGQASGMLSGPPPPANPSVPCSLKSCLCFAHFDGFVHIQNRVD